MSDGFDVQSGVVLVFGEEGLEALVAQGTAANEQLAASVETYASTATSAYAQANAAQRSIIDAYVEQAAAARTAGASIGEQRAAINQSIADLERYAVAWASGANASITGSAAAAEAAGTLRVQLAELAAAQAAQAAAAKAAAAEQAAALRLAGSETRVAGYLAEADAIVTSNAALGVQQVELQRIAAQLKQDVAAFTLLGEEGVAAADASAEALTLVQAALASIRAEQAAVISGMAGVAVASSGAGHAAVVAGEEVRAEAAKVAAEMAGVESGLIGMAKHMLPLAAAVGLVILTKDAIEYAAGLEHMSEKLGIATETLSVFGVAARQNRMDVEDMNKSIAMLFKNIDLALHGDKKKLINLGETLGLDKMQTLDWAKTTDSSKILLDVFTAIDKIPDPVTRLAKAQQLLGRGAGAGELLNTIHSLAGADGFAKVTKQAEELGMVVDKLTAEKALEFERGWATLKLTLMGVGVEIVKLLPSLQNLLAIAQSDPTKGDSWIAKYIGAATSYLNPIAQLRLLKSAWAGVEDAATSAGGRMMNAMGVIGWRAPLGGGGATTPEHGLLSHLENVDTNRTPPLSDERDAKQKELLKTANDQLDVATKQYAVASATNVIEAQRAEYALKRSEILKDLNKQEATVNAQLAKQEIDAGTAASVIASDRATATMKLNAAGAEHLNQVRETTRTESEQLRSLNDQLATLQLQVGASGNASALMREQLGFTEKSLAIENERAAAIRAINVTGPNALPQEERAKQTTAQNAIAAAKQLSLRLDSLAVIDRINLAEAQTTREMKLTADAQERGVEIAKNSLALELLNQNAVMTTADVQRAANLERQNALIQLADKRAQADEQERRAVEEQSAVIRGAFAKYMLTGSFDTAAVQQAYDRIKEINRNFNAARIADEKQTAGTITGINFKEIENVNAARAEARYSDRIMQMQQAANDATVLARTFGDPMTVAFADALNALVDGMKKAADQSNEIWRSVGEETARSFGTLFQTLARGGTLSSAFKDMGQSFEQNFGNILETRIKLWTDQLSRVASGLAPLDANGQPQKDAFGNLKLATADQQRTAKLSQDAMMIGQAGLSGYSAGSGRGQATASALAAGVSAGLATGNWVVGVAAAVASLIGSAISTAQKQSEYLYGVPMIRKGQASIDIANDNINAAKKMELSSQLQDSFNTAWNGFVNVMGKLGGRAPAIPDTILGAFQPRASENWEKHFQQYITDTLPKEIAQMFHDGMQKQFVTSGLTSDAFDKFWVEASNLDPTKRVQFWSDLADGIVSFAHAQKVFDSVKKLGGDYAGAKFDSAGNVQLGQDNDFMVSLKMGAKQVYDIARSMVSLTGPDRIAAFKQMGASVDQIAVSFTQFINQVGASIKNVNKQFEDSYLAHNLALAGDDKNKQARLLEAAYNQIENKILHASLYGLNPQDIEALSQQGIGILNQIYSLDPSAAADQWWQQQMATLQASAQDALKLMGDAATNQMGAFLKTIEPFKDYMLGLPVSIDPSIIALEAQFDGLAEAIAALTVSIKDATPQIIPSTPGGGSGGTDPGGGDGGGEKGGTKSNSTTGGVVIQVYLNGTFVDQKSFSDAIVGAVSVAMKEAPQAFAPTF